MPKRNIAMYPAEEEILMKACESPNGIKIRNKDPSRDFKRWSINMRHRLNQCREADRQRNAQVYDLSHPMHGKSNFDSLMVSVNSKEQCIEITPRAAGLESLEIEDIE